MLGWCGGKASHSHEKCFCATAHCTSANMREKRCKHSRFRMHNAKVVEYINAYAVKKLN